MTEEEKGWRAEYRAHRYLEHEPILKLHDRAKAMTMNARGVDRSGQLYWRQGGRWFEMLTHTLEEFALRKLVLPMPQPPKYVHAVRAAELWDKANVPNGSYILKFGRKRHIVDMIEKGQLRVQPAESYDDPSLNLAIADKEYEIIEETNRWDCGNTPEPRLQYSFGAVGTSSHSGHAKADTHLHWPQLHRVLWPQISVIQIRVARVLECIADESKASSCS
jgi:hypothetical protein